MASTLLSKDERRKQRIVDILRQLEYLRKQLKELLDT